VFGIALGLPPQGTGVSSPTKSALQQTPRACSVDACRELSMGKSHFTAKPIVTPLKRAEAGIELQDA
jgi:hypothetical protein